MLDRYLSQIEQMRDEGAVVLLKWDGERRHQRCTVVITRQETDYIWRQDGDDLATILQEGIAAYHVQHLPSVKPPSRDRSNGK